ncbi:MAG: NAD(P)H:quinone oxidoreductase [Chitinispirillaceae bacterium]|nr:NAD(P)H:quinone oxidoreductase [Chitinispirillaceae bacterium]
MKTLVLYYSLFGHVFQLAEAIAAGASEVKGNDVVMRTFPETFTRDELEKIGALEAKRHYWADPEINVNELPGYDAIIFGFPTRYGSAPAQVRTLIDDTGELWAGGKLTGKVAGVFTSSATQHGGQESTILTFIPALLHLGMIVVGLPYSFQTHAGSEIVHGGSPYGSSTVAGARGERKPGENELACARFQGRHTAMVASKLSV